MEPVVTVGLDGSPESLAAARWAADEAAERGIALRLLHAWPHLVPEPTRVPAESDQNAWARHLLRSTRTELQQRHPNLSVVEALVADDAQNALLQAASDAGSEMVVLGSRGLEPVESYFVGDVSMPVVVRSVRPVVLVRARGAEQEPPSRTPFPGVIVALKLSGSSDDLLDFAFRTAAARGVGLLAIHGKRVPLPADVPLAADADEPMTQEPRNELDAALRPWREKYPRVSATGSVRLTGPAEAVVRAAEGAVLLVVGRRRHHLGAAPRLGPVAQAAVHHGRCPVAVVPHD